MVLLETSTGYPQLGRCGLRSGGNCSVLLSDFLKIPPQRVERGFRRGETVGSCLGPGFGCGSEVGEHLCGLVALEEKGVASYAIGVEEWRLRLARMTMR